MHEFPDGPRREAGKNRQRQRKNDAPGDEVEPEERQLPHDRPRVSDQGPRDHECAGRARIRACGEQRTGNGVYGERSTRHDRAGERREQDTGNTGLRPHPPRDGLARQQQGHERPDQTTGQDLRQHRAEQREVVGEDCEEARRPIAEEDDKSRRDGERRDDGGRPVEGAAAPARLAHAARARSADASRASRVMRAKSPAAMASFGATHEPPTASTFGQPRYAAMFFTSIPPVGQNFRSGTGAAMDFSQATPPDASAGKNLRTLKSRAASAIASLTVAQPGSAGTDASTSAAASSSGVPGLTRYFAPAAMATAISERRVTVPTPTMQSGTCSAIALTAPSAALVRSVTSMTGSPPATRARASGTASAARSIVRTGITGVFETSGVGSRGKSFSVIVRESGRSSNHRQTNCPRLRKQSRLPFTGSPPSRGR